MAKKLMTLAEMVRRAVRNLALFAALVVASKETVGGVAVTVE